ncbi:MAG: endonuclease III domain-containing protein [Thermogutta sp.]
MRKMGTPSLYEIYKKLYDAFGPQNWWPGDGPFEVLVGAILVQNTSWSNVEKAIWRLREEGLMSPEKLYWLKDEELEEFIKPVGYYRIKARRLKNVLRYLLKRHGGSLKQMFALPIDQLRRELLEINGVGPETADSIILYAGNLPTFVVDAYTVRIFSRHGWVDSQIDYHGLKDFFESQLEPDAALYNEYHALLVRLGKDYCKKRPRCDQCPLQDYLPEGGPYEADYY